MPNDLKPCTNPMNCILIKKRFTQLEESFNEIVLLAEQIPRTIVLEKTSNYWHGVCRSLIFRFPDDLEILKSNSLIYIKSSSRIGGGDLGVNRKRVKNLLLKLNS